MPSILLVHSLPEAQGIYVAFLEGEGFAVLRASEAASAIDIALQRHPDAIIIDDGLPDLLGFDLIRVLKSHPALRPIPILMLTGLLSESQREAQFAGADGLRDLIFAAYAEHEAVELEAQR